MNDKELADALVRLGIGQNCYDMYAYEYFHVIGCNAEDFVRDWHVAGAVMEKMSDIHIYWDDIGWSCKATGRYITGRGVGVGNIDALDREYHDLPRAIIEAGVMALQEKSE